MANALTGDFDAVAQVSVKTLNRLLASMHQNAGNDAGLPTLPHRMAALIGNEPFPDGAVSGGPFILMTLNIRGNAYVQIGCPLVSLVAQSPRDVDVACWIRAHYYPEPATLALPEFIYGKIAARFHAEPEISAGVRGIRVTASNNDAHITFTDSGLAANDVANISYVIRSFLRHRVDAFLPLPADVPPEALELRAIDDSQGRQALALPISLTGAATASGNPGEVFLDSSDVAIAVSAEYVMALLQPSLDALNNSHPTFTYDQPGPGTATYTVHMKATASWDDGKLVLKITGDATTPSWPPNADFDVKQTFKFALDEPLQTIIVSPSGGPVVDVDVHGPLGGFVEDKAESKLTKVFLAERDKALAYVQTEITKALGNIDRIRKLLRAVDPLADLKLSSADFVDAGVVLRGKIKLSPRKNPHVDFSELGDHSGYTAFDSWVPGGRIKEYQWSWWRVDGPLSPGTGAHVVSAKSFVDRYVLQENLLSVQVPSAPSSGGAAGSGTVTGAPLDDIVAQSDDLFPWLAADTNSGVMLPGEGQICLSITGESIHEPSGLMASFAVTGVLFPGVACSTFQIEVFKQRPPKMPVPMPDPFELRRNVLVYAHAGDVPVTASRMLSEAVREAGRTDSPFLFVLASRIGSDGPSRALAAWALELRRELPQAAFVLADREGAWLRGLRLSPESGSNWRLIDAAGHLAWQHEGEADQRTLAAALREHLMAGPPFRPTLLQTSVRAGDVIPDFTFNIGGRRTPLRRFRGSPLALVFAPRDPVAFSGVVGWVAARIPEAEEERTKVFLISRSEAESADQMPASGRLDYVPVLDADGAIAQRCGVRVRPTVLLVDRDFRVSTVQTALTAGKVRTSAR